MSDTVATPFSGRDLELELLDPDGERLVRLFHHPGGDWEPPSVEYRNLRVDPPAGHKGRFAVLYTGNTLPTVAIECGILRADIGDRYTWATDLADQYRVARYSFSAPGLFIPIDGRNRNVLGLAGGQRRFAGYEPYQVVSLQLFERFGTVIHGLSWESFHRNQPGRVFALWHHHKATIGLSIAAPQPSPKLADDSEWLAFLAANPQVEPMSPAPR
ncbi:MAG: hypothetical protein EYC67_02080 [Betaproteobacteria bacterium]|nr:MAG: hypothetical protein EYC67_02080 [Betaproteobacteria bacterium]